MSKVKWSEVFWFSVLAYAFSWLYWLTAIIPHYQQLLTDPKGIHSTHPFFLPIVGEGIGMFGPMLAAIAMRLWVSKEGFKGSLGLKRPLKYYLLAFLLPLLFVSCLILINQLSGIGKFTWTYPYKLSLLQSILLCIPLGIALLPLGFGEEYGWRSYLLPRLLSLGEVKGTLILGVIWSLWHLPVLILRQKPFILSIPLFAITVMLLAFPFTWLFRACAASAVIVTVFHTYFDVWSDSFTSVTAYPGQNQMLVGAGGVVGTAIILIIVVLAYTVFKRPVK